MPQTLGSSVPSANGCHRLGSCTDGIFRIKLCLGRRVYRLFSRRSGSLTQDVNTSGKVYMHAHVKKCWMEGNTCCQSGLLYHVLDRRSHPQHDRRYCRQKAHDNTVRFLMVSCTEAQANSSSCGLCKIFPPKVFLAWRGSEWTCLHPNPFEPSWETCRRMPGYRLLDFVFRAVYL